jgi:hypothetical protein
MTDAEHYVSLGPGLIVPREQRLSTDVGPYEVELHVVFEEGRFVCDRLTVERKLGGPPVTTEGIREIPVAALVRAAAEVSIWRSRSTDDGGIKAVPGWPLQVPTRAPGAGPGDEHLRAVAATYQLAYATGARPTKAVMERFGLPRATASRWIALARKRGLLGPATPRKAGG